MTSHSKYGRYIRGTTDLMSDLLWMDTGQCEAHVNNLQHLSDQSTDFLWNEVVPVGETIELADFNLSTTWQRAREIDRKVFPLHIAHNGDTVAVVVSLSWRSMMDGVPIQLRFKLAAREIDTTVFPLVFAGDESVAEIETASSTASEAVCVLRLSAEQLATWRALAPTRDHPSGFGFHAYPSNRADGSRGAGLSFEAKLDVWVRLKSAGDESYPVALAFSGREFVG